MGDGRKNVEAFVAFGGQGRVGAGGSVEIEGEVLGEDAVFENVFQKAFVPGSEPDGVVGKVGVGAVGAEIDEKKGHAVAHRIQFPVGPFVSGSCGDFFLIEVRHVCIGDDHVGAQRFARTETDSGGRAVFHEELLDG